jgi:hypothetical protein
MYKQSTAPAHAAPESARNTAEVNFESQRDAAAYIAALVMELRQIAKASDLEKVAASLEQAYYDAFSISNSRPAAGQGSPASPDTVAKQG